ncbi:MAG: ABC transporter substrate-binding protein [Deltaproteobacteria bacterium]|nr:ABC transporter substrate-binding protein [Deltaproteobacteria bacterium]
MRKLNAILLILLLIAAGIIIWLLVKPAPVPVPVIKEIKVGAVINLTGPASTWGQFHAKGQKEYFQYVNEVKGGVNGNKIALTVVDHAYKVPEAVKYVKKFCTSDKMDMIATWDAGSGISVKPIIQQYKVPNINYSTYQGILKPPVKYAFLPFGNYVMDCYAILEYIKTIHQLKTAPKVGLLTYNNAYGKSIHDASKEYATANNIDIVATEEFPPSALDLNTELLRLKERGAEYIFMQCLPSAIIMALKSADQANYDVPFFGTWTSTDPDFFKRGKGLIRDRMHMQFPGCLPGDGSPGMELLETLWARYKSVTKFDTAYWEGVVIGSIMERAFQRALEKFGEINSETINKALETFRDEDFGGLVPDITYSSTDHGASWKARIVQINEDQTFTPLTHFWSPGREMVRLITG